MVTNLSVLFSVGYYLSYYSLVYRICEICGTSAEERGRQ